jgi:riboflavin kinase/FMN adenylyltransferase
VVAGSAPRLLTTFARKAELVAGLGVEELVVIPFDREFARRSAQDFVDRVLVETPARHVRRRGARTSASAQGQGDADMLRADPRFETRVEALFEADGRGRVLQPHPRPGSSAGPSSTAGRLLGDPFTVDR